MRTVLAVISAIVGFSMLESAAPAETPGGVAANLSPEAPRLSLELPTASVAPFPLGFLVGESVIELDSTRLSHAIYYEWNSHLPQAGLLPTLMHFNSDADPLDALGELFDIDQSDRPWSSTTTVHLLALGGDVLGRLVPFASVAHEVDSLDAFERIGIGGGAQFRISSHATFNAELLHFGDQSGYNATLSRETRFLARIEIDF